MNFAQLKTWFQDSLKDNYEAREASNILKSLIPYLNDSKSSWSKLIALDFDFTCVKLQLESSGWLQRLKENEPLAYILGEVAFHDLMFKVDPNVLIPRPETEELVNWVLEDYANVPNLSIIDIGTGSGCIPISLGFYHSEWQIKAVDICKLALDLARTNASQNGVKVDFLALDILNQPLIGTYDVIVSNPPYITKEEIVTMSASTVRYEPELALFTGDNSPLTFYKRIGELGLLHLNKNGVIFFELNEFYANQIKQCLEEIGYRVILKTDLQGKTRMAKCTLQ